MTAIAELLPESTRRRLDAARAAVRPAERSSLAEEQKHHRAFVRDMERRLEALDARIARIGSRR